jgi:hypothetical protein
VTVSFIDENRAEYGVEPICSLLPIAPSTFYDHQAKQVDPERRSERAKRDDGLVVETFRDEQHRIVVGCIRTRQSNG